MLSLSSHVTGLDWTIIVLLLVLFSIAGVILIYIPAPYGKFTENTKVPFTSIKIDGRIGFAVQEFPSVIIPILVYIANWEHVDATSMLFLLCWETHYIHR